MQMNSFEINNTILEIFYNIINLNRIDFDIYE